MHLYLCLVCINNMTQAENAYETSCQCYFVHVMAADALAKQRAIELLSCLNIE